MKLLHISFAAISFALFFLRGYWHLQDSALLGKKWVKVVPHVNDTLLFASGVFMVWQSTFISWDSDWLLLKLAALLVYILLGMYAFKWAPNRRMTLIAWLAALAVFVFIVDTAVRKAPVFFF